MAIAGVRDEDLVRFHSRSGGGRGELGYRHLPTGIVVCRPTCPDTPVVELDRALQVELRDRLIRAGFLTGDGPT